MPIRKRANHSPLVSIIIPTMGRATLLRECLLSVQKQNYSSYEVIIVDDSPHNQVFLTLKEFQSLPILHIHRLHVKKRRAHAITTARNLAISIAQGQFIAFLDSDDLWYPDHLQFLVNELSHKNFSVATACYDWIDQEGKLICQFYFNKRISILPAFVKERVKPTNFLNNFTSKNCS